MAITLEVDGWCRNCPNFEPKVNSSIVWGLDNEVCRETKVTCANRAKCESMIEYLEKEKEHD